MIRQNLKDLNISTEASVMIADASAGLQQLAMREFVADSVFLDPPYNLADEYKATLEWLNDSAILGADGFIIAEHARRNSLPERFSRLVRVRVVEQGDAALSFYRRANGP